MLPIVKENINKIHSISNYLSFQISEYFFDLIVDNNYHIEKFLTSFKKNLSNIIYETLEEDNQKTVISNVFNYYAIIAINKESTNLNICFKEIEFDDIEDYSNDVELILDCYFNENDGVIKSSINNIDIYLMPLFKLNEILKILTK